MQQFKVEILTNINPKDFFPDSKHIIVYAFSIGKYHYFKFDDILNLPYNRALQALVYYKEVDMNCDREFLKAHTQAIENILTNTANGINIYDIKTLNDQLKRRLNLPKEPELMYKLAAVNFFDQFENPDIYEFGYGEKKINAWKKTVGLEGFFLSKPMQELIPYLKHVGDNLKTYSLMVQERNNLHLESLLPHLSEEQKKTLTIK